MSMGMPYNDWPNLVCVPKTVARTEVEGGERRRGGTMSDSPRAIWNMGKVSPMEKWFSIIEEKWRRLWNIQKH